MAYSFDLLVLGGGPGGYVAALRAAQLGLKVCLVEKDSLGGVCLNKGCIPSKTLLAGTELFSKFEHAGSWGIEFSSPPRWNVEKLFQKKEEVVTKLRQGLETLCQKRKVHRVSARGKLIGPHEVETGHEKISAAHIVLATGSSPKKINFENLEKERLMSSEEAFLLKKIPSSILILGGGPEGLEFSLIFKALGAKVFLVEAKERLLPGFDRDAGAAIKRVLNQKGIETFTGDLLEKAQSGREGIAARLKSGKTLLVDSLLVCAGREPNTKGIGLEALGVRLDKKNAVVVDGDFKTSVGSVYAVGDVTGHFMMAHAASYEGYLLAEKIAGRKGSADYRAVPSVVYTYPEVAQVGLSEEEAKEKNIPYETGRFSFMALGRAHAKGQTEGFVKVIGHANTEEVLGGVIVGESAGELINLVSLAVRNHLKMQNLREHIAPHPTASEAVTEAAHLFFKEGLHFA